MPGNILSDPISGPRAHQRAHFKTFVRHRLAAIAHNVVGLVLPAALRLTRKALDIHVKILDEARVLAVPIRRSEVVHLFPCMHVVRELEDLFSWRYHSVFVVNFCVTSSRMQIQASDVKDQQPIACRVYALPLRHIPLLAVL
ncbi:hypothetical protein AcV7_000379 [Taiwanofungus camphoratus]|nr:hypothetical protein AcV7_000379 [Antrodia cinnamomea]